VRDDDDDVQAPGEDVKVEPTLAAPEIFGARVFVGAVAEVAE
jgi:hypothetical protein